jgi:sugar phosphate isomerase/epimerase/transposase
MQPDVSFDKVLRQHDSARPCLRRRGKRGQRSQAFGRSRGGFPTKIHLRTDIERDPLNVHLTGGEASDSKQFETSLDIGPDIRPRTAMIDEGYDSLATRVAARARGITPVLPRRENSRPRGRFFPNCLYKLRARIEPTIGRLKRFRRVAMRREATDVSYSAIVGFACGLMLVQSVHTTRFRATSPSAHPWCPTCRASPTDGRARADADGGQLGCRRAHLDRRSPTRYAPPMTSEPRALSINTATLGFQWGLDRLIAAAAGLGLGGVAPWRRDLAATPAATARRMAADAGLAVTSLCRGGYLTHRDSSERAAVLDDNRRAVDEAAALGAPVLCFVVGGLPRGSKDLHAARAQVINLLSDLRDHARGTGVRLAVEPLHPMYAADRSCINTIATALDVCDAVGGDTGVMVDAYHLWWDPLLPAGLARAGAERILGWQISDWLVPTRDFLNDRGMMGDGVIDLPRLDALVADAGWRGLTEVEIFSDRWSRIDPAVTLGVCVERFAALRRARAGG